MNIPKPMQIAIYTYIALPVLIFFSGWIKLYIGAPLCVLVVIAFYRAIMISEPGSPQVRIKDNLWKFAIAFGIIFFWVLLGGIGKFTFQNADHSTRNSLFELLVYNKWPVIIESSYFEKPVGLVYYIGFWLPPALIGKCFGMQAGYFAQTVWASIGVFLFYYMVTALFVKKAALWPLVVIVFFSGLDILGKYLMGEDIVSIIGDNREHIEWWIGFPYMQYSSMTTQLFWVFNQTVPIWLCTVVIVAQKNSRIMFLIFALSTLSGALPAVGLGVLVLMLTIKSFVLALKKKPIAASLREFVFGHLTFENYVGVVIALVFALYFAGNLMNRSGTPRTWSSFGGVFVSVVVFFSVEAGVYLAAIAPFHKRNYLFYYVVVMLLFICPWYIFGVYNDFCMRASIPAVVILMCLVIEALSKAKELKMRRLLAVIICLLIIGGVCPLHEITRSISYTIQAEKSSDPQGITSLNPIEYDGIRDQYYGYSDNVFFKYLAK
ncbi:MAG: hypothetical protein FWH57_03045 [Oscillospiraceae bacterium]|nr:hypothetical protein [Oscillospiraceae bacterium]